MKKITFHILTLFPEMFESVFASSIISRAVKNECIDIKFYNLRHFAFDKHKTVDDKPYGGGPGMVLKVDVMDKAIEAIKLKVESEKLKVVKTILLTPQGRRFDQKKAEELSKLSDIILICGHYEGFDERIREHLIDEELSIGDFVLSGGEIPAMAVVESVARLVSGVLGKDESAKEESFSFKDENDNLLLEYPIYTRPAEYKGWLVPEILQNGNHAEIKKWRQCEAIKRTKKNRADLLLK